MAMDPYKKRMLQGAAQGAVTGGSAGFMLGGPVGGLVGLGVGGLAGGLMARPGDDEKRLRARMRKLEMGVLGDEATSIRQRFMNPVRGAAQEQEVRRRALEQGTALSGAAARRGQAAQRAARGDIAEAGQEATLAVMDLGEQRRQQAQRINEGLLAQEEQRDRAFRRDMLEGSLDAASMIGQTRALKQLGAEQERRALGAAAGGAAALGSDEELLESYAAGRPREALGSFTDEDVAALQLGGGIAPSGQELDAGMAATRAALDARAVQPPVTAETVDDFLMSRAVPVAAPSVPVPGDAMTPTLMGRGESIGSGAAVQTLDDVGVMADVPLDFREQRDMDRAGDVGFLFGADAQLSLLSGNDPDGILSMPESEYKEYINNAKKQSRFNDRKNLLRDIGIDVESIFDEQMQKFVFDGSDDEFMDFSESLQMMPTGFFVRMGG